MDHRLLWDVHRREYRKTGIVFAPVRHPQVEEQLWLVVSRPGKGRRPWYLLTNEPIAATDDARPIALAYARRWQVEMCYRACKTDLAMESPRLWFWENRLKLLLMVSLVYAFLLSLLAPDSRALVQDLLRSWRHRTGKGYRGLAVPFSRLRAALSSLWLAYPPSFSPLRPCMRPFCVSGRSLLCRAVDACFFLLPEFGADPWPETAGCPPARAKRRARPKRRLCCCAFRTEPPKSTIKMPDGTSERGGWL